MEGQNCHSIVQQNRTISYPDGEFMVSSEVLAISHPFVLFQVLLNLYVSIYPAMSASDSCPVMPKDCAGGVRTKEEISSPQFAGALSCEMLIQNYSNFKRSACPERLMFYENGSWAEYPEEIVEVMKLGFSVGKQMVEVQAMGFNCLVDFCRMLEVELNAGNYRSISWIDVNGKCFFPRYFVNSSEDSHDGDLVNTNEMCPKIHVDIKIRENSGECEVLDSTVHVSKRKRVETVDNDKLEGSWSSSSAKRRQIEGGAPTAPKWDKVRILGTSERAYAVIKSLVVSGLEAVEPGAKITSINQCVRLGPLDRARHQVFVNQIEITKQLRGQGNVMFAWYGTSASDVENILTNGFGIPEKAALCEGYGIGIHLSTVKKPEFSAMLAEVDGNGEKHLMLCRVILGTSEKVEAESRQSYPSSMDYDTGVDDLDNPKWYTVWHSNMNTHLLPEYVVSYRPTNLPGFESGMTNVHGIPHPSIFAAKLLSRLQSILPMFRFREMIALWGSYKEAKLKKDVFVNKLRAVVGDDVLCAAIKDIRG